MSGFRTLNVRGHTTSTAHRLVHYPGACSNVHGHNMEWNITLQVEVPDEDHQMAVDFKDVSNLVDVYDHAILLNKDDPLVDAFEHDEDERFPVGSVFHTDLLGDVVLFEGDPTCENITDFVAEKYVQEFENVKFADVEMAETDKYSMSSSTYHKPE